MRYTVRKSIIDVVGTLWQPGVTAAERLELTPFDVENIKAWGAGTITREAVQAWLDTHTGDFSRVIDFHASIEDEENTVDIPWTMSDVE